MTVTRLFRGSCLCSDITFEAGNLQSDPAYCHCTMCRKFHGAAFGTLAAAGKLNWLSGEELLRHYKAQNGTVRTFCDRCGTSIAFRSDDDPATPFEIAIALFDEDLPIRPAAHIFLDYRASWYALADGLPAFGEGRQDDEA